MMAGMLSEDLMATTLSYVSESHAYRFSSFYLDSSSLLFDSLPYFIATINRFSHYFIGLLQIQSNDILTFEVCF